MTRLRAARWSIWFGFIYLVLVSTGLYLILSQWAYDDPFITYRYARNLAQGYGFVYNPGERILSTTTPLFTLLLAALYQLSSQLPRWANLIGSISLAAGALLIWDLARIWQTPAVGWAGLLLYPTFTLPAATVGSETPLYIALCLAAFDLYARRRYSITAAIAALAALTRPDGILVAVILAGDYILHNRRKILWQPVLVYSAITLPWVIFAWAYFRNPIPVTLAAKQYQGNLEVSQYFAPGLLWIFSWYQSGWQYWLELFLAVLGLYWFIRFARQWSPLLAWTGLYFIAYALLQVSRYFWYYAPLLPGYILLVGLGVEAIVYFVIKKSPALPSPSGKASSSGTAGYHRGLTAYLPNLAAAILLVPLSVAQLIDLWHLGQNPDPKGPLYRASGEWLRANTPAGTQVGSLEAGMIGYYSERPMVDFAGLLKPEVARQMVHGATYDGVAEWAMRNYAPEYALLVTGDLQDLKKSYLDKNCRIVQRFAEKQDGQASVNIYYCPQEQ